MEKQMKRTVYEAPLTDCFQIELEGAFMSGSIVKGTSSDVETTGHEINEVDVTNHDWNDDTSGWQ